MTTFRQSSGRPLRGWARLLPAATLLLPVLLAPAVGRAQDAPLRIGVADLERIVLTSPAGKALQARLEAFQRDVQAQGEAMTREANAIRDQARNGASSLSEDRLRELQQQYEDKVVAIRRLRDDKTREAEQMRSDGLEEIEKQLEPVFKKLKEEKGYDLILNNAPGVVILAGDRADITDEVLAAMNVK